MQKANAWLTLDKFGSNIPLKGVTPAEAVILHIIHQLNVGGPAFKDGFKDISEAQEVDKVIPATTKVVKGKLLTPAKPAIAADPSKGILAQPAVEATYEPDKEEKVPQQIVYRPRNNAEEMRRLSAKYGGLTNKKGDKILKLIYAGITPQLPQTFAEFKPEDLTFNGVDVGSTSVMAGVDATGIKL